jgi:hypothetical protein
MTAPFSDQGEAAVCARVALALIRRYRKQITDKEIKPLILIGITVSMLDELRVSTIRTALLSLSVWVEQGRHSKDWLRGVIYRDMMGYSLRRCYHFEYKANRRDPRVTNRGVTPGRHLVIEDTDPHWFDADSKAKADD